MAESPTFEPGRLIGLNYRVVRCIGRGGMGEVYEVEHIVLGVRYAMKTFVYDGDDYGEMLQTKFLEEGQVLARLKHPNLIHVFDLAMDRTAKVLYYVMDLVLYKDGNSYSLEDVDRNDLDEVFVYNWFCELCDALDYIHSMGVVHRDIKEANLLLGSDKHVMLSDFGISHIFGDKLVKSGSARKTMPHSTDGGHAALGTEHYMAPEVLAGCYPTPAADAYSLGVTIFRLLTGVWYEPDTDVFSLLKGRKYRWSTVLPRLLARDPAARPQKLVEAARLLKARSIERTTKKKRAMYVSVLVVVVTTLLLVIAGEMVTAHHGKRISIRVEEQKKAQPEQLRSGTWDMHKKLDELAKKHLDELVKKRQKPPEPHDPSKEQSRENLIPVPDAPTNVEIVVEAPAVKYKWYTNDVRNIPCEIKFKWLSGASCRFVPLKCGERQVWMSRYPITVGEWRELRPKEVEDLMPLESSLLPDHGLSLKLTEVQALELAELLTARYRKSLLDGYVIRVATSEEKMAAIAQEKTEARCRVLGLDMDVCVGLDGAVRRAKFAGLKSTINLAQPSGWSDFGVRSADGLMIAGLSMPHASGVCDLSDDSYLHIVIAPPIE